MYIYFDSHNPKYNGIEKSLRANQMSYIEGEQTTQWPKEKVKQRSAKHTHKTKEIHKLYIQIQNVQKVR